jgi:hypothetical protein
MLTLFKKKKIGKNSEKFKINHPTYLINRIN